MLGLRRYYISSFDPRLPKSSLTSVSNEEYSCVHVPQKTIWTEEVDNHTILCTLIKSRERIIKNENIAPLIYSASQCLQVSAM